MSNEAHRRSPAEWFLESFFQERNIKWMLALGAMIAMPLPLNGPAPKQGIRDQLQTPLWEKFGIEIPIIHWHGERLIRVSCHLYNTREQIDRLIDALADASG